MSEDTKNTNFINNRLGNGITEFDINDRLINIEQFVAKNPIV